MVEISKQGELVSTEMFHTYQDGGMKFLKEETKALTEQLKDVRFATVAIHEIRMQLISRFKKGCDKSQKEFRKRLADIEEGDTALFVKLDADLDAEENEIISKSKDADERLSQILADVFIAERKLDESSKILETLKELRKEKCLGLEPSDSGKAETS